AVYRIMSDLKQISDQSPDGVSAAPSDKRNLLNWTATIVGPDETPFEGGIFNLSISFTEHYPEQPPKIKFTTDIFHPNVYPDGSICLDILTTRWSPVHTLYSILTSIQSLLTDENPDSPANPEAANLYISDRKAYRRRVRLYVERSSN
ncbi:hypothetical protein SAMD00019534_085320, partial [Acytostelium subglobosum LB1]|uniref:hypothetical protein n=1 Tax=Acytostelium subglobosum LB1 TaxID=1410327 RepID=UPI0006448C62